jgi:hypothetical protein
MVGLCRRIASSRRFQNAILAVIVANAVLIGLETSPALWERYGGAREGERGVGDDPSAGPRCPVRVTGSPGPLTVASAGG